MTDVVRCDVCKRAGEGSRTSPPTGWGAYNIHTIAAGEPDEPGDSEVSVLCCSVPCLVERFQVLLEMHRDILELTGGDSDV